MRPRRTAAGLLALLALAWPGGPLPAAGTAGPDDTGGPELRQRRENLARAVGKSGEGEPGVVVLWGEEEEPVRGFRQTSDFLYLSGVQVPEAVLVLEVGPRGDLAEDHLFLPGQTDGQARWVGRRLRPEEAEAAADRTGFDRIHRREALDGFLRDVLGGEAGERKALWAAYRDGRPGTALSVDLQRVRDLREQFPHIEIRPLRPLLVRLRQVKDEAEVAQLRAAVRATAHGLEQAMAATRPGVTELELRGVIEAGFFRAGARRVGFESIVGSGPNTCILHYPAGWRILQEGDLVLMDVGAETDAGYTADVTRTVPVSGTFTPRQREIYELVLRAQEAGFAEAARKGATLRSVHEASRAVLEEAGHGDDFWHYTGHWLGLDVHDVGLRDRPLEPGMVFTVEPGLYLPEEQIGIRIEDDVLVTRGGIEILSADIPRSVAEVERAMRR